jgi:hypothetical protein
VFALSKWLGGVWAGRILESQRASLTREQELLVRRRNVYAKLAVSMRIFLNSGVRSTQDQKDAFLAAYDEACLWSAEDVMQVVGTFLDLVIENTAKPGVVAAPALQAEYVRILTAMRKDCGFPETKYNHRVVSF